jgi:hypothetical protein
MTATTTHRSLFHIGPIWPLLQVTRSRTFHCYRVKKVNKFQCAILYNEVSGLIFFATDTLLSGSEDELIDGGSSGGDDEDDSEVAKSTESQSEEETGEADGEGSECELEANTAIEDASNLEDFTIEYGQDSDTLPPLADQSMIYVFVLETHFTNNRLHFS